MVPICCQHRLAASWLDHRNSTTWLSGPVNGMTIPEFSFFSIVIRILQISGSFSDMLYSLPTYVL